MAYCMIQAWLDRVYELCVFFSVFPVFKLRKGERKGMADINSEYLEEIKQLFVLIERKSRILGGCKTFNTYLEKLI